ncbi:molybdopterin-guanine dinucleotide biosynthesis protein B [Fictibacillus aquaticus]|nr:molybdopterin-guanine dinucleotide biosynthesis protein B [Fictibacillus aquaticus]
MELKKPVLQIAGYSNSGKTTLVCRLIEEASKKGWAAGTLKHHGHGGTPLIIDDQKDSGRHREAGAAVTGVEGGGTFTFTAQKREWSLSEMLSFYEKMEIDLILVEGFKTADLPKIVMVKEKDHLSLLEELTNIQAVISYFPFKSSGKYPVFLIEEEERYIPWFTEYISGVIE